MSVNLVVIAWYVRVKYGRCGLNRHLVKSVWNVLLNWCSLGHHAIRSSFNVHKGCVWGGRKSRDVTERGDNLIRLEIELDDTISPHLFRAVGHHGPDPSYKYKAIQLEHLFTRCNCLVDLDSRRGEDRAITSRNEYSQTSIVFSKL